MGTDLKQGSLFGGKTWFGIPEGNLVYSIKALVHQVSLKKKKEPEPSASIGESKGPLHQRKKLMLIYEIDSKHKFPY